MFKECFIPIKKNDCQLPIYTLFTILLAINSAVVELMAMRKLIK